MKLFKICAIPWCVCIAFSMLNVFRCTSEYHRRCRNILFTSNFLLKTRKSSINNYWLFAVFCIDKYKFVRYGVACYFPFFVCQMNCVLLVMRPYVHINCILFVVVVVAAETKCTPSEFCKIQSHFQTSCCWMQTKTHLYTRICIRIRISRAAVFHIYATSTSLRLLHSRTFIHIYITLEMYFSRNINEMNPRCKWFEWDYMQTKAGARKQRKIKCDLQILSQWQSFDNANYRTWMCRMERERERESGKKATKQQYQNATTHKQ